MPLRDELQRRTGDDQRRDHDQAPSELGGSLGFGNAGPVRRRCRHGSSAERILFNVSAEGLYFCNSFFSLASVGSSVGYGRYSMTSRVQRDALVTPAASR